MFKIVVALSRTYKNRQHVDRTPISSHRLWEIQCSLFHSDESASNLLALAARRKVLPRKKLRIRSIKCVFNWVAEIVSLVTFKSRAIIHIFSKTTIGLPESGAASRSSYGKHISCASNWVKHKHFFFSQRFMYNSQVRLISVTRSAYRRLQLMLPSMLDISHGAGKFCVVAHKKFEWWPKLPFEDVLI